MGRTKRLGPAGPPSSGPEADDSGLIVSFAVGPSGVGPVMGFGSDDFFPVAPVADVNTDHISVDAAEVDEAEESRSASSSNVSTPDAGTDLGAAH